MHSPQSLGTSPRAGTELNIAHENRSNFAFISAAGFLKLRFLGLILITPLVAWNSQSAMAQMAALDPHRIVHQSWTFKDGAPEQPRAFAQTADGYLWVGAPAGLFRFDGLRFELFRSSFGDQLQSTNVSALLAPKSGGLWVGYVFGGFSFIKDGRVTNYVERSGSAFGFSEDANGIVWCAASLGLWRFNGSSWQPIGAEWGLIPNRSVIQVGLDRTGTVWALAGTTYDSVAKTLYFLPQGDKRFRKAGDSLFVRSFTWDADASVVTSHEQRPAPGTGLEIGLPAYPILRKDSEQVIDRANRIWFFDRHFVLNHPANEPLPATVRTASPQTSDEYDIDFINYARFVDLEGNVWVGGVDGVHRLSYSPLVQQELPKPPGPFFVVAPDERGAVWISAGNGLGVSTLYRVESGRVRSSRMLGGASSFAYRAPDKTSWFGGEGGLWHLVNGVFTRIDLPQEMVQNGKAVFTMTEDAVGGKWVSFGNAGLYRLKDGIWTRYERQALPNQEQQFSASSASGPGCPVLIAYTDPKKRVWFGCTRNQLAVLEGNRMQSFGPRDGVQVGNVTAFYGRDSKVWIGGEFGLQQFDQGRFRTIHSTNKELLRGISGIVQTADGDLWLNGLGGIIHLGRGEIVRALEDPAYQVSGERLDRRAGLPGLASQLRYMPTATEGTDGRLWFNVNNGVVWVDPKRVSNMIPPPRVSIQSVSADEKGYELGQAPRLPAHTANVQISWAAISLLNPEAIRFRYMLQEADKGWHDVGTDTSVSYRSLAPGLYHFRVEGSDTNGRWSDQTATLEFAVLPAFYQTRWFTAFCAAAFIGLLWAAYHLRVRQLHHEFEMTLDARIAERTRIAREIHDTLLQSAHGVLLRFQTVSYLLPAGSRAKQQLDAAIEQTAEFITEARDQVQGLRTSSVQTNDLAYAISTLGEELATDAPSPRPSFHALVEGETRSLHPIVRDEIYKIAAEALRNAFQHAQADRVEMEIRYDNEQLRLRVRDDGKGIDPAILSGQGVEGHYGLNGMRERAAVISGKLTVWSAPGTGTELELRVPAKKAYEDERRSWFSKKLANRMKA